MARKTTIDFNRDVKDAIVKALEVRGWSNSDLARAMNVTRQSITDMLREDNNLSLGTIEKISKALGMRFKWRASAEIERNGLWVPLR